MQTVIYKNAIILRYFGTKKREKYVECIRYLRGGSCFLSCGEKEKKNKVVQGESFAWKMCIFYNYYIYIPQGFFKKEMTLFAILQTAHSCHF